MTSGTISPQEHLPSERMEMLYQYLKNANPAEIVQAGQRVTKNLKKNGIALLDFAAFTLSKEPPMAPPDVHSIPANEEVWGE